MRPSSSFASESRGINFDQFMSDDNKNLKTYYVHGKDNIPFHTTIYPALLMGLEKNYRLPDYIVSSAYVNLNNEKMSKSKGDFLTVSLLESKGYDPLVYRFMCLNSHYRKQLLFSYDILDNMTQSYHKLKNKIEAEELDIVISPRNLENWARQAKYEGYLKAAEKTIIPIAKCDRTLENVIRGFLLLYKWR